MMNSGHAIGTWRSFIKNKRLGSFPILNAHFKGILFLPDFKDFPFKSRQIQSFIFLIPGLHTHFKVGKGKKIKWDRSPIYPMIYTVPLEVFTSIGLVGKPEGIIALLGYFFCIRSAGSGSNASLIIILDLYFCIFSIGRPNHKNLSRSGGY